MNFTEFINVNKHSVEDKKKWHLAKLEEIKEKKLHNREEFMHKKRKDKDLRFYIQPHDNVVLAHKRANNTTLGV